MDEALECWNDNMLQMEPTKRERLVEFIRFIRAQRVVARPTCLGAGSLECGRGGSANDPDGWDGYGANARRQMEE